MRGKDDTRDEGGEKMTTEKIAVSTTAGGLDDAVCPTFGRCGTFTIVEVENGEIKNTSVLQNPGANIGGGAGIQAAQTIINSGAKVAISGAFGPNSFAVLSQAGIKTISAGGMKVKDAVDAYIKGTLKQVSNATAPAYQGLGPGYGRGMGRGRAFGYGQGQGYGQGMGRGMGRGRRRQW